MGVVKLQDLRPGMVLGKPVFDQRGSLVLKESVSLTEKHIELLKTWRIASADIQGENELSLDQMAATLGANPEVQEELRKIAARFAGIQDEVLLVVRDAVKHRLLVKAIHQ